MTPPDQPGHHVVFFGPVPWDDVARHGYRKTSGAMFRSLRARADITRLTYVEIERRTGAGARRRAVDDRVEVVTLPSGLPLERVAPFRWLNRRMQARALNRAAGLGRPGRRTYWFYDWVAIELLGRLPPADIVMEITDSAAQFYAGRPSALRYVARLRALVKSRARLVVAVAPALAPEAEGGACRVVVIPNGISREFLESAARSHDEPAALAGLPHPRLCVVGTHWSLNHRLDHDLLVAVLDALPAWHLVIVGCDRPETPALRRLVAHPRVRTIGMVPQDALVAYLAAADVCAVPYKQGPARGDALKVYEYLACGKPVLLTADAVVDALRPYVDYAGSPETFAAALERRLHEGLPDRPALKTALDAMTWDRRAEACLRELSSPLS